VAPLDKIVLELDAQSSLKYKGIFYTFDSFMIFAEVFGEVGVVELLVALELAREAFFES
jgi:hypothetical protein